MARMEDVEFKERLFLKGYPFKHYSPRPGDPVANAVTPLQKPLSSCTVGLVTTAGLSLPDQPPFDLTIRNGDSSFREIPSDISPQLLDMHHRSPRCASLPLCATRSETPITLHFRRAS